MDIRVLASTKEFYTMPKAEALEFSGRSAGICYLPDTVEMLWAEDICRTRNRVNNNLKNGHHSVFGHPTYNLILEDIPKILAIILNNEKAYTTSEKSARYTKMNNLLPEEKILYDKWYEILKKKILRKFPNQFNEKKAGKLAQENARYFISVFTPATTMEYTVSFEQLNYILYWFKDYIQNAKDTMFSRKLKVVLQEFIDKLSFLSVEGLTPLVKGRKLSLFADRTRNEEWGENYCTTYFGSFAQFAQAQRHRTLSYEIRLSENVEYPEFYTPDILCGEGDEYLRDMWIKDMKSVDYNFPQGMLIQINERGTIENFYLKCTERLCGSAQLEIMKRTEKTLKLYYEAVNKQCDWELEKYLRPLVDKTKCQFLAKNGFECHAKCAFGPNEALNRII